MRSHSQKPTIFAAALKLILLASILSFFAFSQTTTLTFRPNAAEYSQTLDRLIMISQNPNLLHVYDAASRSDQTYSLPSAPKSLSVSPDGVHAAIAFDASLAYVDLNSGTIQGSFPVSAGTGAAIMGEDYIYVFPSYAGSVVSVNIGSGQVTNSPFDYVSNGRFNPSVHAIYGTRDGLSPNDVLRYSTANGPVTSGDVDSPYHGDFSVCGPVWFSPDFQRIYTGCGTVFHASTDPAKDMRYLSSLGIQGVQSLSESAAIKRIAAIPKLPYYNDPQKPSPGDTEVRLFESDYLNPVGRLVLTPFTVGSRTYAAHGHAVFFNRDASSLYILTEADSSSGLLNDYALQTVPLTTPVPCPVSLSSSTGTATGFGSLGTMDITGDANCTYQATSNAPWIQLVSGYYGSGKNTLTYQIRPNLGSSSRTSAVSIGNQAFTVTQDGASQSESFGPLSFRVVAADYSKSLDRLVLASGNPNELHLLDPVSGSDQLIALPSAPLSISVRPDGQYAAVGHNGWVSIVNLQALTIEQIVPVESDISGIVMASNGYVYAFPSRDWSDIYSLQVGTSTWTATSAIYTGRKPRLHQSGKYLYVGGNWFSKWDITGGVAQNFNRSIGLNNCGNIWLTEDGNRMFTACGTVYRTTEASDDLSANGSLLGNPGITWAAHSVQQHGTAIITLTPTQFSIDPGTGDDTKLQIYDDAALTLRGRLSLPSFVVGSNNYAGHGKFVFWNSSASKLYTVEQADSKSGLLSDFAVYIADPSSSFPNCPITLSTTDITVSALSSTYSIQVNAPAGCSWTAYSGNSFLTISSGSSGSGSGMVIFTASRNYQNTTITSSLVVADQEVRVRQLAASSCSVVVSPGIFNLPSEGGTGSIAVTADNMCSWGTAGNASWLSFSSGIAGYGNGTVTFGVTPNSSEHSRSTTMTVGDQTVTVVQGGTAVGGVGGLRFVPVTPCRLIDTRLSDNSSGGPTIAGQTTRDFVITSQACSVPATAAAYSLNITAVPQGPLQFVTVWPAGEPKPDVSTLNSFDGRVRANATIVHSGSGGAVSVFATETTDMVIDINGYFVPDSSALAFYPLPPCRITDTRIGTGTLNEPSLKRGQERTFAVRSSNCNVPATAQAYSLNFTTAPKGRLGWMAAWPTGKPRPLVSTLNAPTGAVTANAAIVPAGANGSVNVFTTDDTELIIDINGYFAPPAPGGLSLYTTPPCRVLDTRVTGNKQMFTGYLNVSLDGTACSVPSSAEAYVFNAAVAPKGYLGWLSLWPLSGPSVVSTLNATDGQVTANMAIVPSLTGPVTAFASDSTHLILDLSGYFAP